MAKYLTKGHIKVNGERYAPGVEVELTDEQAKSLAAVVSPKAEPKPAEPKPEPMAKPEAAKPKEKKP